MSPMFTDIVTIRGGATPQTFDGNQTFRFNNRAARVVGLSIGQSQSIYTTDEGFAIAVRLSENIGLGSKNPVFIMGWTADAGPSTNHGAQSYPQDYMPLDIPVAPNSTMRVDIATVAGAVQTGTHDVELCIHYDSGDTPSDVLAAAAGASGVVPVKGGVYGYTTALTTTSETALTGNGTTLNVPAEAKQIIGFVGVKVLDTAVTQSEELGGKCRFEFSGISDQGKQEYPLSGGTPGLGTEVEGGNPSGIRRLPMFLDVGSNQEIQTSAFVTFLSAITGGADVAINLLWR